MNMQMRMTRKGATTDIGMAAVCLDCTATRAAVCLDLDIRLAPGCPVRTQLFSGRKSYQLADDNVPRVTSKKRCVLSENVRGRCTSSSAAVALMVQARTCLRGTCSCSRGCGAPCSVAFWSKCGGHVVRRKRTKAPEI